MRRRCLLAEQLEPRLVMSVVGGGSRGAGIDFEVEAPPGDDPSTVDDSSSDGGTHSEFTASEVSDDTKTTEPTSSHESTESDAATPTQAPRRTRDVTESETDSDRPSRGTTDASAFDTTTTEATTAGNSSDVSKQDTSATTVTRVLRLSPSVDAVDVESDTGVRVIVLRRVGDSDLVGNPIAPRQVIEVSNHELAFVTTAPQVVDLDATSFLHNSTNGRTDHLASSTIRARQTVHNSSDPVTTTYDESWLSSLASSVWSWLGLGDATNLAKDATSSTELPLVALAGMFTFATISRKGATDGRKFLPPITDERFELIQRRSWRERRRGENNSRAGRSWQRSFGRGASSPVPVDNGPTLAQPDISEAFVMSMLESVPPDAFVMSPILPAHESEDDSPESESNLSPSMKLVATGAVIGSTAIAGNALANRRSTRAKRPTRPAMRFTGTTVVPQSSRPQTARL